MLRLGWLAKRRRRRVSDAHTLRETDERCYHCDQTAVHKVPRGRGVCHLVSENVCAHMHRPRPVVGGWPIQLQASVSEKGPGECCGRVAFPGCGLWLGWAGTLECKQQPG